MIKLPLSPTKITLIGCGGIGCAITPWLVREFDVRFVDFDTFEPGNADRQFPALQHATHKAECLQQIFQPFTQHILTWHHHKFASDSDIQHPSLKDCDLIVSGVDNNFARHHLKELSLYSRIPMVMAGNGHDFGEAFLCCREFDPFDHFDFPDSDKVQLSCTDETTLEEFPQTATANMLAAGAAVNIIHSLRCISKLGNALCHVRLDRNSVSGRRVSEFPQKEQ